MTAETDATDPGSDQVPAAVLAQARAAFGAVDRTAAVAALVSDSLDEDADPDLRTVVFAAEDVRVVVTVSTRGADRSMHVEVDPAPSGLDVECQGEPCRAEPAGQGRWSLQPVPSGPVSLCLRRGESVVRTSWTRF